MRTKEDASKRHWSHNVVSFYDDDLQGIQMPYADPVVISAIISIIM